MTEGPELRPGSNSERECPLWVASGHFGRWAMKPWLVFGLKPRGAHTLKGVPSEWRLVETGFVPKLCLTQAHSRAFQRTTPSGPSLFIASSYAYLHEHGPKA